MSDNKNVINMLMEVLFGIGLLERIMSIETKDFEYACSTHIISHRKI